MTKGIVRFVGALCLPVENKENCFIIPNLLKICDGEVNFLGSGSKVFDKINILSSTAAGSGSLGEDIGNIITKVERIPDTSILNITKCVDGKPKPETAVLPNGNNEKCGVLPVGTKPCPSLVRGVGCQVEISNTDETNKEPIKIPAKFFRLLTDNSAVVDNGCVAINEARSFENDFSRKITEKESMIFMENNDVLVVQYGLGNCQGKDMCQVIWSELKHPLDVMGVRPAGCGTNPDLGICDILPL